MPAAEPVVFDPFSDDFFLDPYETYRRLRDEAPVYRDERYGFYALSRYADVLGAHRDWRSFSNGHGSTLSDLTDPNYVAMAGIISMDPPDHDRMRRLVSRVFTPRAVSAWEGLVSDIVEDYLLPLEGRESFDVVEDFAAPFPVEVISTILGVPPGDRQLIRHNTDLMLHREPGDPTPTPEGMAAGMETYALFAELVAEKRRRPEEDMISRLTQAPVERQDGGHSALTDAEISAFAVLLAAAGSETVTKLVGAAVCLLHRHRREWAKLVADPSRTPAAVEEALRYWPPSQYQGRFSAQASTWEGREIPAGVPVLLLTGAACHDERAFAEPERFDIDRIQKVTVAFGHGIHACLGAALARLEARVALDAIARRWPGYGIDESRSRRVSMSNVAGFSHLPFAPRGG